MAALPKRKLSRVRSGRRAASKKYEFPKLSVCPKCGSLKLPHYACSACGFYKENQILKLKENEEVRVSKVEETKKQ